MSHATRIIGLLVLLALTTSNTARAQFLSEVVGFNGPPIDDPATSQEMFRQPEFSGSTSAFIVPNTVGLFDQNVAFRASGLQTEGTAAMDVLFQWVDPADPAGWLRLSTFGGPERPNPSLHTQGKVRFKITNRSELFAGTIGICLGIRETGNDVPMLADGGTTGDIEWVGVTGVNTDPNGAPLSPIPAITLPPSPAAVTLEWDLATGIVSVNGVPQGGGIAGFTGDGILNPANDRGTLEHIAITNVSADTAVTIEVAIDELQFESPDPDPVLPPRVVSPIILGDPQVTVTDLMASVDQVNVLRGGAVILTQNVASNADVAFTLAAAAQTGESYTATQRDSITGFTSGESPAVIVLPEASPYALSFVLDEDGDGSCSFDPPGGWEFVGATSLGSVAGGFLVPVGTPMFNNNAMWQSVDFALDDPAIVQAWLGGNGTIDPSPTGLYSMDTIWFDVGTGGALGPHEVFIDAIQVLDANDVVIDTIHDFEDGTRYMSQIRGQSNTNFTTSDLSALASFDGLSSHRVEWSYSSAVDEALGMLTRVGFTCGTSPQFTDAGAKIRFHVLARSIGDPNAPPIPAIVGPIVGPQTDVRVSNDAAATALQLYVNGAPVGAPVVPASTLTDFGGLTLQLADSISAKQTIGGQESDFAYPLVALGAPPAPTVDAPISPGSTSVSVSNFLIAPFAIADFVLIYKNGAFAGSAAITGDPTAVPVQFGGALVEGDLITATQFVNSLESPFSAELAVGLPGPVLYAAPAQGDAAVRVLGVDPSAALVEVFLNGGASIFSIDPLGASSVFVPVTGLLTGDTITARMTVGGIPTGLSDPETVTVPGVTASLICDDLESYADQLQFEGAWTQGGAPDVLLSTDRDATCVGGGSQSTLLPAGSAYATQSIPLTIPTPTEPVVLNVNIFDPIGVDPGGAIVNWVELNHFGGPDFFFIHVGILGWADTDNVHYDFRAIGNGGPNWLDLDELEAPERSPGWHNFTVVHKGDRIDVYVDGLLSLKNLPITAETTYGRADIGGGFASTDSIYVDDFCVEVGPVRFGCIPDQPPAKPAVAAAIEDGDESVTVNDLDANVTLVEVVDESMIVLGSFAGAIDPNDPSVTIALNRPLVHLERITAEATNVFGTSASDPLEVGDGNGDVLLSLGVRETGDAGALGTPGSLVGTIEWIGASSVLNGAPQGKAVSVAAGWQTITFDPTTDPILGFTGDGVIDGTRGVLEHLAIAVNAASAGRSSGGYNVYIDNVVNVGADGGADFVIEDFESFLPGEEVLFQEPTFSGSTDFHLTPLPSASEVNNAFGNPGQSELLVWFFKDTTDQRWTRIVTSSTTGGTASPIIDLTRPIRMDVRLAAAIVCVGDLNGDNQVNLADLAIQLSNFGTPSGALPEDGDIDGDGDVDLADLAIMLSNFGTVCS